MGLEPNFSSDSTVAHKPSADIRSEPQSVTTDRLMPQERYQEAIVIALNELDGRARTKEVLRRVGEILEDEHTSADLVQYDRGGVRWRARASSEALVLKRKGVLEKDAGYGWWELTEKGKVQAQSMNDN